MAKKVWILERYIDSTEMAKALEELKKYAEAAEKENNVAAVVAFNDAVVRYQEKMQWRPEGYWSGHVGSSNYKQFCRVAKDSLRFWLRERGKKVDELRVVEGYVEDNAKEWVGYTVAKVNDGVKKYLLATM